nr:PREDICTED: prenylated Rab acceptor protein 1 [Bemisia tabaci]
MSADNPTVVNVFPPAEGLISPVADIPDRKPFWDFRGASLSVGFIREWAINRYHNVRPWLIFFSTGNFKAPPPTIPRLSRRFFKNINYFEGNYFFICFCLMIYGLVTSPLLLLSLSLFLVACYFVTQKNTEGRLKLGGVELTLSQQYTIVGICFLPIFYWADAGTAVFWAIGASMFVVVLHAATYHIELLDPDPEDQFDLTMQSV